MAINNIDDIAKDNWGFVVQKDQIQEEVLLSSQAKYVQVVPYNQPVSIT